MYVTDIGSHQIRSIRDDVVRLVAGTSPPGALPLARSGGYLDGPAAKARFNEPTGVAVAKDGTLYVSDALNHCVRMIRRGNVSTFATGFISPRSISIDDDGNLYVADFGTGIRRITPTGAVTTIWSTDPKVFAVTARGSGTSIEYAITAYTGIYLVRASGVESLKPGDYSEPYLEDYFIGREFGVAFAGDDAVLVTDLLHPAVRYVRLGGRTTGYPMARTLAGDAGGSHFGGFHDGAPGLARVDVPLGVARAPDGRYFFTDAGNRRIRVIAGLDTRSVVPTDELHELTAPPSNYRVVVVGASVDFEDVLWPESIPGQIESMLRRYGPAAGLRRPISVRCVRLNGTGLGAQRNFINEYLGEGEADLVILTYPSISQPYDIQARPDLKDPERLKATVRQDLLGLKATLQKQGTKFMMVFVPDGSGISDYERTWRFAGLNGGPGSEFGQPAHVADYTENEHTYTTSGVHSLGLYRAMLDAETQPDRVPLFNTYDEHPSTAGATWIGRAIANDLLDWRPWR